MLQHAKQKVVTLGLLAFAAWALSAGRVHGWGPGGHRVVANIAYDRLDPAVRSKIVKIIRSHDDFKRKFDALMPDDIRQGSAADRDRWIFLQASIWPDLVRPFPPFHMETWHFVNFPFFLSKADENALKDSIKPNVNVKLPPPMSDEQKKTLNCMQAFNLCLREISDSHSTDPEKALYYCWLLHIGGDTHQPLHSTSLISRGRFNESEGDRGGHLPISHKKKEASNLHAFWDQLHGEEQEMGEIIDRSAKILEVAEVRDAAEKAITILKVDQWIQESHQLAKTFAYTPDILKAVADAEATAPKGIHAIHLRSEYQAKAQEIANRRVAEAGYRLAELLNSLD